MPCYTYILHCSDNTFYIGYTTNLKQRLKQHNGLIKGGAKYTRSRKPIILVHAEQYKTKQKAMKREYELKQLTRKQKEELCTMPKKSLPFEI